MSDVTFAVILAAAGRSTRFGGTRGKKPFVDLAGRPVWWRAAAAFAGRDDVRQTLVVVAPDDVDWFAGQFRDEIAQLEATVVAGGGERHDSVFAALERVREEIDFVAVHDAARPLVTPEIVGAVFSAALESGAAIPAVPAAATLKRVAEGFVSATVDRRGVQLAQTPQVVRRELLLKAYASRGELVPTDEAQLVEHVGRLVAVVAGSPRNFKITTQEDLEIAEALLAGST